MEVGQCVFLCIEFLHSLGLCVFVIVNICFMSTDMSYKKIKPVLCKNPHVGDTYSMYCDDEQPIRWYFVKSLEKGSIFISTEHKLEIDPVQIKDGGTYYCYGQYPDHSVVLPHHFVDIHVLQVYGEWF